MSRAAIQHVDVYAIYHHLVPTILYLDIEMCNGYNVASIEVPRSTCNFYLNLAMKYGRIFVGGRQKGRDNEKGSVRQMAKLSLFFGLLMAGSNFTSTTVTNQPPPTYENVTMTQQEVKFVELVNKERAARGLSKLSIDPMLVEVGRKHSREMADKKYFNHHSPTKELGTPLDRYLAEEKSRPTWALVGENLFYCSIVDVERGHVALMNSEGHRKNILEPRYERIGVGSYTKPNGEFYVTEMFLAKTD